VLQLHLVPFLVEHSPVSGRTKMGQYSTTTFLCHKEQKKKVTHQWFVGC
jgi:hypothetical protein